MTKKKEAVLSERDQAEELERESRRNPDTVPVELGTFEDVEIDLQAAPSPPSTPGLPVPAGAPPAMTPPTPPTVPLAPVQSWAVPALPL